jgi:LysM repeat protein
VAQNTYVPPDDVSTPAPDKPRTATPRNTRPTISTPKPKPSTHTVTAGDTLASIARKAHVSLTAIRAANPGVNPTKLRVGQVLNLPAP